MSRKVFQVGWKMSNEPVSSLSSLKLAYTLHHKSTPTPTEMNFFLCDLLRHASGVRGDVGVYPARPSALYTPTGPLGQSVAFVDLKQPSMHRRSSICPLRCARDPVTSSFSG
ncbi:hypothetical protein THAOC_22683, partial [Thalassiosira oceanica]